MSMFEIFTRRQKDNIAKATEKYISILQNSELLIVFRYPDTDFPERYVFHNVTRTEMEFVHWNEYNEHPSKAIETVNAWRVKVFIFSSLFHIFLSLFV